ncbi:MAG: HAD family hydrolase [Cyanobacteria bacterium Co-bin8]|nr:HAD family hydrolase [Cyanobacteria bacterium Co-bin8]
MTLEGVILDVDGTLVLSNDVHAQCWVEAFAKYGYTVDFEKVRPMMGMGGDKVIPQLFPDLNDEEGPGKEVADYRKELVLNDFRDQIEPAQGSRALVQKLRAEGLNLIIATSASAKELETMLKIAQVDDLLKQATSSDDADASKPSPDIVEAALHKADLDPSRTVMLGDTPYDIEAAGKAGVDVIAFRCGGFDDEALRDAIAIYDDPADLLRHYDQSPLAQKG